MWLCKCDCEIEKTIRGTDLRNGKIISCQARGIPLLKISYTKLEKITLDYLLS